MIGADLIVPVGDDEEGAQAANAAAEEAEELERGAVGPMGVLADDDRWLGPGGEGGEYGSQKLFAGVAFGRETVDLQTEGGRQVTHRPERTRGREGVARGAEHGRRAGNLAAELIDERRLADPGFAANK